MEIFYDIDNDGVKLIDLHKSKKFNKYIDESINDSAAEKDANDFIKSCAICNKQTVILIVVNISYFIINDIG